MARSPNEQALIDRFSNTYKQLTSSEIMMQIELAVCGCSYGCTSWTTKAETLDILRLLDLGSGVRLLDIGSGTGWPGLYLAQETGCDVTLTDLPLDGLLIAQKRAEADGLTARCIITQSDGAALPFRDATFDAIYHSDVLCCLVDKRGVLESCRRVINPDGGRMAFSVIMIAPGLSDADYAIAAAGGPTFIETGTPYPELLEQTGWEITDHIDQTADYFVTFRNMYEHELANKDEMIRVRGAALLDQHNATLVPIERGLLRRELFRVVAEEGKKTVWPFS